MWWEEYTTKVDKCCVRRKKSGEGGKSILHHSYAGKDYAQQGEVRSASVDELPIDEVYSN